MLALCLSAVRGKIGVEDIHAGPPITWRALLAAGILSHSGGYQ